jgi:hypothetical protein
VNYDTPTEVVVGETVEQKTLAQVQPRVPLSIGQQVDPWWRGEDAPSPSQADPETQSRGPGSGVLYHRPPPFSRPQPPHRPETTPRSRGAGGWGSHTPLPGRRWGRSKGSRAKISPEGKATCERDPGAFTRVRAFASRAAAASVPPCSSLRPAREAAGKPRHRPPAPQAGGMGTPPAPRTASHSDHRRPIGPPRPAALATPLATPPRRPLPSSPLRHAPSPRHAL